MQIPIQILISVAVAAAFDWALNFQTQLFGGIATDGRRPGRYRPPGLIGIALIVLYLIPINVMVYFKMRDFNFWWIALLVTLPAYAVYRYSAASGSVARDSQD